MPTTPPSLTRREAMTGVVASVGATLVSANAAAAQSDLTLLSIEEASKHIAAGSLKAVNLTRAYLDRIEKIDRRVNAYITVLREQAMAQAQALDAELANGRRRGPLHGIPIALKDNIDTAGIRTTAASALFERRIPTQDAPVVQRLRDAGAVFLGKLNLHEFAFGGTTAVTHFGPTHNPWNLAYTPGGSSGGSAAAVAARLCAGALGTDTAASIRLPAAFCGVVGLKATHGAASIRGIIPLSEWHDHVGPIARSVGDCSLIMNALIGYDPLDPVSVASQLGDLHQAIGADVSKLRIGLPRQSLYQDLDPEIAAVTEAAIEVIKKMTSSVRDVTLPSVDTSALLYGEIYAYHAKYVADAEQRKLYQPLTLSRILDAKDISLPAFIEAKRQMTIARNTSADLFKDVDVMIAPTSMAFSGRIDDALKNAPNELPLIRNTLPFNVLGNPTISVPCGFSRSGLPIGLQISGPRFGEARVLALAHAYEQATQWHLRQPPMK